MSNRVQLTHMADYHVPDVVKLGVAMHAESDRYNDIPFDEDVFSEFVSDFIFTGHDSDRFAVVAYVPQGAGEPWKCVGVLLAFTSELQFSRSTEANDAGFYVIPEYRGSKAGPNMLAEYVRWALKRGVSRIGLGVTSAIQSERATALLTNAGMKSVGQQFEVAV